MCPSLILIVLHISVRFMHLSARETADKEGFTKGTVLSQGEQQRYDDPLHTDACTHACVCVRVCVSNSMLEATIKLSV